MIGITKLNKVSEISRLLNEVVLIPKNDTHYRLSNKLTEYFNCEEVVLHDKVNLKRLNVVFIRSCDNELLDIKDLLN